MTSFCAGAVKQDPEVAGIACVALGEAAAEKFVALTRRIGEVFAGGKPDDTLVRHLYDLTRLDGRYDADDCAVLAKESIEADVERGYDAYKADPFGETHATVARMAEDKAVRQDFDKLMAGMVYGETSSFEEAMAVIEKFAIRVN